MEKAQSNKDIRIKYPELVYSIVLIAMLCILGGGNNLISTIILAGFIPLVFKPEYLICPLLFTTIWSSYILVANGQSLARYLALFFIFGVLIKLIQKKEKIKIDFWFITIVVSIILSLILSLWGAYGYTASPVTFVLNMILFLVALYCPIKSKELLIKQIWYFAVMSIAYAYWFILRNGLDVFEEGKLGTLEEGVNSNSIGKGLCYLAAIVLAHFLVNNLKGKVVHVSLILTSIFLLLLTGSRTSLLAFVITAAVCIVYWTKLNSKKIGRTILFLFVTIIGCYLVYNYLLEALPTLMERFTLENTLEDGGTGRTDVWRAYLNDCFPKYWFLGMGFDPLNLFRGIEQINGVGHGAHNIIIDILASTGMVGLTLFSSMFFKGYHESVKIAKHDISILIPFAMLTAALAVGIGENVLRGRTVWLAIAFIILWKKQNYMNENNIETETIK